MSARRTRSAVVFLIGTAVVAAIALLAHGGAARAALDPALDNMEPMPKAMVVVFGCITTLLALRYLAMLGLALIDHARERRELAARDGGPGTTTRLARATADDEFGSGRTTLAANPSTLMPATPREPGARAEPLVSILMPVFNEGTTVGMALRSLMAQDYPNFEILVIDDGSSDHTYLKALVTARSQPNCRVRLLAKPNGGKADALNHGLAHAGGEFVVCIDGDSVLAPDAVSRCIVHFDDPRVGAVAGNVRVANRDGVWESLQALEYTLGLGLMKRAQSHGRAVTIVPGPLGMFRKRALVQVAGYDSDTFAEDFDLTLKLLSAKWHVAYEPGAVVMTEAPESMTDLLKQRYRWTRGSLQAIGKRRWAMFAPRRSPLAFSAAWYLWAENVVLPIMNVGGQLLLIVGGLTYGMHEYAAFWWVQLVMLDIAIAFFCVAAEREPLSLLGWSPLFRLYYLNLLDVARLFAGLEQLIGVRMGWGKLTRLGRLR